MADDHGIRSSDAPAQRREAEPVHARHARRRATLQVVGAALALILFLLLVLVLRENASTGTAIALVAVLFLILVAEVLLVDPIYTRLFQRVPASLPLTPDEDNFIVGCPGCGTVFTVLEEEIERGSFACHNCGRPGYVKDHQLNRGAIKKEQCATCGNAYLEYKEHSECPVCHTYNAY